MNVAHRVRGETGREGRAPWTHRSVGGGENHDELLRRHHTNRFVEVVRTLKHGESCRVKTVDLSGRTSAYTVKTDHNYWRPYTVFREAGQWVQKPLCEPE